MQQPTRFEGRTRKHQLWQALQAAERNDGGEIPWSKNLREALSEKLGVQDNLTVANLLYQMESSGHIKRRRASNGREVLAITLLEEPPAYGKKAEPKPKVNGAAKGTEKHSGEVYAEVMEITPAIASEWLDLNTHNRTLRQQFIERLAEAIKRGEWVLNGESIKKNATSLVDGQHRLWAIVLADKPVRALVAHNVPLEAQETVDTGVKRTLGDILKLRGEKDHVSLAATLVQVHIWQTRGMLGLQGAFYPTPQQAIAILANHPEIRDSVDVARRLSGHIRYPNGLGATLHWIFNQIDPDDATDFFNRLTTGHNLDEGNPILALRTLVLDYGPIHNTDKIRLAALMIKAWNFYRSGNEVQRLMWKAGGAKPEAFPKPV